MRKGLILTVFLLALLVTSAQAAHPAMPDPDRLVRGYCSRVVDGDTAWIEVVEDAIPVAHTYRLIGVDTPETVHPDKPAQYYGREAKQKAELGIWAPAPAKVMQIDLKGMTLEELQALQARITDELQDRSDRD